MRISTGRSVTLASDCAAHISSATEMTETSDESLISVISVLAIGGSMRTTACGRMMRRITCVRVMPRARPACRWPLAMETIPARKISAR